MILKEVPTAEDLTDMGFTPLDKAKAQAGIFAVASDDPRLFFRPHPTDSADYFMHVRRWVRRTRGKWESRPAV